MDTISADSYSGDGKIFIETINVVSDASGTTTIQFTEIDDLMGIITSTTTASSSLYDYDVSYDETSGCFSFTNTGVVSNTVMEQAVSSAVSGYTTQVNIVEQVFKSVDTQIEKVRKAKTKENLYASTTGQIFETENNISRGLWLRPYMLQETIKVSETDIDNTIYGTLAGIDLPVEEDILVSFYLGYAGSKQEYNEIKMNQAGYIVGVTGMYIKEQYYLGLTANAILNKVKGEYNSATDKFDTNMYSVGTKAGYNFDIGNNCIVEPNLMLMYGFVNCQGYETSQGAKIDEQNVNNIMIEPQIKLKWQLEDGWQPYGLLGYVANIGDKGKVTADDTEFEMEKVNGYVEYGVGVSKDFDDTPWNCYFQITGRNGGRNGVAGNLGVKYCF